MKYAEPVSFLESSTGSSVWSASDTDSRLSAIRDRISKLKNRDK